jgi:cytochrome c551/c552
VFRAKINLPAVPHLSFLQSPQRIWLDLVVGVTLLAMLGFGSVSIYRLNNDARELELSSELAMQGQRLSTEHGCIACHTLDGSLGVGPSWLGMWGKTRTLQNGETVVVDEVYFRRSIRAPESQIVAGYPNVMLRAFLDDEQIDALMAFAQSLAD